MSPCHLFASVSAWQTVCAFEGWMQFSLWLEFSSLMLCSSTLCVICHLSQWSASVCVCFGVCMWVCLHVLCALSACSQLIKTQRQLSCFLPVCPQAGTSPNISFSPLPHFTEHLLCFPHYWVTVIALALHTLLLSNPLDTFHLFVAFCWYQNSKHHIVRQYPDGHMLCWMRNILVRKTMSIRK